MRCNAKEFAELYKNVYKDLYKFALCIMKDPHDAEDAVSEAVIQAYSNITQLRNEEAFKIYKELIPDSVATKLGVERYCAEPYVYSSNIRSPRANDGGKAGVSWLTGTATWMMVALSEYIYGIKPTLDGLEISPCITNEWDKVKVQRRFRGCMYNIEIDNSLKCGNRVKKIYVDGKEIEGNVVLSTNKTANVLVVMG